MANDTAPSKGVEFSQDVFDRICDRIAGGESLRTICADADMPSKEAVRKWLVKDAGGALVAQYARAREAQADAIFDEIIDIADTAVNDWMEVHGQDDAGYRVNGEHIQRSKLRIDARKWMAGKLRPKVYGEKLTMEGAGEHGEHLHKVSADDAFARLAARLGGVAPGTAGGASSEE